MTVANSNYANIRTQLKTILLTVSGVGNVHDYVRGLKTTADFLTAFQSDELIKGWWIERRASTEERIHQAGRNLRKHIMVMCGIYGYDDMSASGKTFDELVESVCDTFRDKYDLNGTCFVTTPIQVENAGLRMMGSGGREILCHYAELKTEVTELLLNV